MGRNFKKIKAWQIADKLALDIYKVTKKFPVEERYGIVSQVRRAAVSIPTNIAEGSARNSVKEYLQFLYISKGSLIEVEYLLYLSKNLRYLSMEEYQSIEQSRVECIKTLSGLIGFIVNNPKIQSLASKV